MFKIVMIMGLSMLLSYRSNFQCKVMNDKAYSRSIVPLYAIFVICEWAYLTMCDLSFLPVSSLLNRLKSSRPSQVLSPVISLLARHKPSRLSQLILPVISPFTYRNSPCPSQAFLPASNFLARHNLS